MRKLNFANVEIHFNLIDLIQERRNIEAKIILQCLGNQPQNLVDNTGSTLLHYAVKFNNIEIVCHLLQLGCKNNAFNNEGHTPLMLAAMNNRTDLVEILFKFISDAHFRKLLEVIFRCEKVCPKIVKSVFKNFRNTNSKETSNLLLETKCPLYNAVFLNKVSIVKIMLDNGCSVNAKNPFDGNSPLHVAIASENINLVRLLVKHGANVNAVNHKDKIPLNLEIKFSCKVLKILKILVKSGLSLTSCDDTGRMQISKIVQYQSDDALKVILGSKIDLNVQDQQGDTVVHYRAEYSSPNEIFALFVKQNFNPNIQNNLGQTPLHLLSERARCQNDFNAIRLLLEKGTDVNIKSRNNGIPPLHTLIIRCMIKNLVKYDRARTELIRDMLVEYGADIQYVTNNGKTILDEIDRLPIEVSNIVLFYFARLEAQGTVIIEPLRRKIDSTDWIKSSIISYSSKLEQLKTIKIHELVTMSKLLTCSKIKFRSYLRNEQLATELRRVLAYNAEEVDWMYIELLKIRMNEASNVIEWQQKAEVSFCKLVDSNVRFPDLIFSEVMNYLSIVDLKSLALVECYTNKRERPDSDENVCKRKC